MRSTLWRLRLVPIALICALMGGFLVDGASQTVELVCDRATGAPQCVVTRSGWFEDATETYGRAYMFGAQTQTTLSGKGKSEQYAVALLDEKGGPHVVIRGVERGDGDRVARWLADPAQPSVSIHRASSGAGVIIGILLALVAPALGLYTVLRWQQLGERKAKPKPASTPASRRRRIAIAAFIIIGIAGTSLIASLLQGDESRLDVTCEYRCKFDGADCLPGGAWSAALPPGRHQILVWNPALDGKWESQEITMVAGEDQQFTCRPRQR